MPADPKMVIGKDDASQDCCSTGVPSPELAPGSYVRSPALSWSQLDFSLQELCRRDTEDNFCAEVDFCLPDATIQEPWSIFAAEDLLGEPEGTLSTQHFERLVESLFEEVTKEVEVEVQHTPQETEEDNSKKSSSAPAPHGEVEGCTTAMLRNLPNKYMREKLVHRLHECGFTGDIDFLYLPIDFRNKCNVGYCFINFRTPEACTRFKDEFNGVQSYIKLPGFNSKKVLEVSPARVQGLMPNIQRLQGSPVMAQAEAEKEWLPILLDETGGQVEFPLHGKATETMPAGPRREVKSRTGGPRRRYKMGGD
mmetsp:Transcript_101299/g.180017  ORF Transcript_101299/g.180017 Transcript_101299/m.180017 type:complete len:309 (+) Transcript_101299:105-1031(+)